MIIHKRSKKIRWLFFLAGRTNAEEFDLMGGDLVPRCLGHLGRKLVKQADVRIDDAVTSGTDQVRVRVGLVAVVAVASIGEADLQDFPYFLEQGDGFVDRGEAGGRKRDFYLVVNIFNARMDVGTDKSLQDGNPLRCDPEFPLPQFFENVIQTLLRIVHRVTSNEKYSGKRLSTNNHRGAQLSSRLTGDCGAWEPKLREFLVQVSKAF